MTDLTSRSPWHVWRISYHYRFAVCLTPRCGSTSVSNWYESIHADQVRSPLRDGEWLTDHHRELVMRDFFTLGLIRDPWSRMVSAYLGKIVKHQGLHNAQKIIRAVQQIAKRPDNLADGITFREFVYATRLFTDDHWRPLVEFMPMQPAYICTPPEITTYLETMTRDLHLPQKPIPHDNCFDYGPPVVGAADLMPAKIRQLPGPPRWDSFYDPELCDEIRLRYQADIARFNFQWDQVRGGLEGVA